VAAILLLGAYSEDGGLGKGIYFLCSEMSALDYMMEEAHSCTADDANAMAFKEVAKIIEGRDVVEEFLSCGVLPLSNGDGVAPV
jgi:hypothetical protein